MIRPHGSPLAAAGASAVSVLALAAGTAHAQVLQAPRRAAEFTVPRTSETPLSTSLIINAAALGGYDDNVSEGGDLAQPGAPPVATGAGGVFQFTGGLDYRRSKGRSGITFGAHGSGITYSGVNLESSGSADGTFSGFTSLGRGNTLSVTEAVTYESLYALGALAPIDDPIQAPGELPTGGGVEGLLRQRSWASDSGIALSRQWSRRNETSVDYNYNRRTFLGNDGETSSAHTASASYTRTLSRTATASANYGFSTAEYAGAFTEGPTRPVDSHNIDGTVNFTKRISPRRSLYFGFGGGASRIETVSTDALLPYAYWAPTASVDTRLDLSMTWTLSGNFRRTTTAFQGLNNETFLSDIFGISVGGPVNDRLSLVLSTGGARGDVDASAAGTGSYTTGTAAVLVSLRLTRTLAASAQYSYYNYQFSDDTPLAEGVPQEFNRNAVRAGLTLALPLNGRQARTPRP